VNRALVALLLAGCGAPPTSDTCDPQGIRRLADAHGFDTAFEPCGTNNFRMFAWSPDGRHLLFALGQGAYVLDARTDDMLTIAVPTGDPIGTGTWASPTRLVLPTGPTETGTAPGIATYDVVTHTMTWQLLAGLSDPTDLTVGDSPDTVRFTAVSDGRRGVWQVGLADRTLTQGSPQPLPWAVGLPVERFSYQPAHNAVLIGAAGTVTLYDTAGTTLARWDHASRGVLHPGGRWVALEGPAGEEPPTLSIADRATGARWPLTGLHGTDVQWYEASDYRISFIAWGFDGQPVRRNVVLGDLASRMAAAERGATIP